MSGVVVNSSANRDISSVAVDRRISEVMRQAERTTAAIHLLGVTVVRDDCV